MLHWKAFSGVNTKIKYCTVWQISWTEKKGKIKHTNIYVWVLPVGLFSLEWLYTFNLK